MDGRVNNKGTKNNDGGNPGYGALKAIRDNVKKYCPLWWKEWEDMMKSKPDEFINDNVKELLQGLIKKGDKYSAKEIIKDLAKGAFYRKQFAMTEFNKLQAKLMPTIVGGDGDNPLILQFHEVFKSTCQAAENSSKQKQVQGRSGRPTGRKDRS
ncbi:hypothetical protein KKF61_07490 [Patescibacteria group bacterium]|nr:hypothetical protein [Patescibacteria group bacterium]